MSLNGIMGIGISSPGAENPWSSQSPAAVDFQRAGKSEVGEEQPKKEIGVHGVVRKDYVTLQSAVEVVGTDVRSTPKGDDAGGGGRAFDAIA